MDLAGPDTGPGRWRDDPLDEQMSFAIAGRTVTITTRYSDGSGDTKSYEIEPS